MAARTAREDYEAQMNQLLSKVWDREGENLVFNPVDLNTPLSAVLEAEKSTCTRVHVLNLPNDEDLTEHLADTDRPGLVTLITQLRDSLIDARKPLARVQLNDLPHDLEQELKYKTRSELSAIIVELIDIVDEARADTLHVLLNFLFAEGPNPLPVSERAFMVARAVAPNNCWNMKQWEAAAVHGLIKQTWQAMESRLIEELLSRLATTGIFTISGGKSHSARQRYSEDKQGNTSRLLGRKLGDDDEDAA